MITTTNTEPLTPEAARSLVSLGIARGWIARPGDPHPARLRRPYEERREAAYRCHDRRTARLLGRLKQEGTL